MCRNATVVDDVDYVCDNQVLGKLSQSLAPMLGYAFVQFENNDTVATVRRPAGWDGMEWDGIGIGMGWQGWMDGWIIKA